MILIAIGVMLGFVMLWRVREPSGERTVSSVSVIVPARDEEATLPALLRSLPNWPTEVIVVDDGSTDDTAAVARTHGATVVHAPPLPDGWVGKSWACHIGARHARGDVLVFVDADVTFSPGGLDRAVGAWEREAPDGLLSIQPFHRTRHPYEQLSAYPNLVAMMASGAFGPGRTRWSPVAFGPCLVTAADAYRSVGGHEVVADEVIEDVRLARAYGDDGRTVRTLAGGSAVSFRMYPGGVRQLVDGWTKNLSGGPRLVSPVPMLAAVAWVAASAAIASTLGEIRWEPLAWWAVVAGQVTLLLRRIGRFSWWAGPAWPILLVGFVALFAGSTFARGVRRTVTWHGRSIAVRAR